MNKAAVAQQAKTSGFLQPAQGLLQRKCACGNHTMAGGECAECSKKKRLDLQTKLTVNEPGDIYEQEADRIANQVMATPAHPAISGAPPRIQRFSGPSNGQMDSAPASVDNALASPGRPLEPALRQDMEQRFGHDFSQVRVHSGDAAEQSARELNANAYTVGRDVVFAVGQFSSTSTEGRKLLAHELVHVMQQSEGAKSIQRQPDDDEEEEEELSAEIGPKPTSLYLSAYDPSLCGGQKCITDEEIYRPLKEANKRIEREISREREISKKPYYDRFWEALYRMSKETYSIDEHAFSIRSYEGLLVQTPDDLWKWGVTHDLFLPSEEKFVKADAQQQSRRTYKKRFQSAQFGTYQKDLTEPSTGEEVWYSGRSKDLFLPSEKEAVIADREKYLEEREGRRRKARAQEKRNVEIQQYRNWVARGEQLRSPAPIIQPFAFAAFGPLVAAAYGGTQTGAMVGEAYNACTHGTEAECAASLAQVGVTAVVHQTTKGKPGKSSFEPPTGSKPKGSAPEPSVWVQYKDGRVVEYQASEMKGNLKVGSKVSRKGEGQGRVVSLGDPPHSSTVLHEPLKPLITDEALNQPIPLRTGLAGSPRQLTRDELKGAKEIREAFDDVRLGDPNAMNVLAKYRPKQLTGDLAGWWEVDLLPGNPGALNQMRILFRIGKDGQLEVLIRQMH
ncbi:DUF4157 domain-containing protein [Nitrosomonas sp. HPC101]|uniref:eCIS core domain-containing protein n=1 Tax=Nitrosomonas sp. HPC101 TaxID=1658667 RepID=UPI0019605F39|nr:DUF4157 domain-containing protein [Nitrosomonas sp. HPC101]